MRIEQKRTVQQFNEERQQEEARQQELRKIKVRRFRKRALLYSLIATITFSIILIVYLKQSETAEQFLKEKEEVAQQLEAIQKEQEQLNTHLALLDDDDYIEKLARQQYLMGKKNEIIFSIPSDEKEEDKE